MEDSAKLFIKYKNGAHGVFITSTGEYPETDRLEISGDSGKLVLENGVMKWRKLNDSVSKISRTADKNFNEIPGEYIEFKQEKPINLP